MRLTTLGLSRANPPISSPHGTTVLQCLAAAVLLSPGVAQEQSRTLAISVGTIHTVSGADITNGTILIRGGRITAVGPAAEVTIPANAEVLQYPGGHAYPGLVDALSAAFAPPAEIANAQTSAGTDFFDALDPSDEPSRAVIRFGITTAYVSNRSTAPWRGLGAIIRPHGEGFTTLGTVRHGGLGLRMTTGPAAGHALNRLTYFDGLNNTFDTLDAYRKSLADHEKALEKYEEDFEAYLKYYREGGRAAQNADNGRRGGAAGSRRGRGGQGQRGRGRRGQGRRGQGQRGQGQRGERGRGDQQQRQARGETEQSGADQAPARPRWPAAIKPNPAQEALLRVVQGEVPLRIEAHRVDEIRAALALATAKRLPGITLEFGSEAGEIAEEIAAAGAPVIITDLLAGNAASYEKGRDGTLPGVLHRAGVPVAIASGSLKNSRNLTLMAAFACGQGLPEDAAIRAITLTPAEILGIADQVGSLEKDKVADVLITSGPLLQSDTRILRVVSRSRTWHEVK